MSLNDTNGLREGELDVFNSHMEIVSQTGFLLVRTVYGYVRTSPYCSYVGSMLRATHYVRSLRTVVVPVRYPLRTMRHHTCIHVKFFPFFIVVDSSFYLLNPMLFVAHLFLACFHFTSVSNLNDNPIASK